jgi:hypothetical protein
MNWTILSGVIDPVARTLELSRGNACTRKAATFTLDGASA